MKLRTIIPIVIALLVAVGWGMTYSSLSSKLEDANEVIRIQKQENTALLATNTGLRSKLLETEEAVRKTQEDLRVVNSELVLQKEKYSEISKKVEELDTELTSMKAEIKLYKETFGEVYLMPNPPINVCGDSLLSWRPINLENSENIANPSWMQLKNFLKTDKTDMRQYIFGSYVCGNYAEDVHNNAEAAGIRAAVVLVEFTEGENHALNAFKTTDKGLVYIDCTGLEPFKSGLYNMDTTVALKLQGNYHRKFIFPTGWYFVSDKAKVTSIIVYW